MSLTDKVGRAKALVLTDYRGLKHKQFEEVRKLLKKLNAELVVAKNRLLLRALANKGKGLEESLQEPTATLFAFGDEISPLKELLKYFKSAGAGKTKAGLLGAQILTSDDVTRLATLPPRNILLGMLASELKAPISGLHRALSWNIQKLVFALKAIETSKNSKTN